MDHTREEEVRDSLLRRLDVVGIMKGRNRAKKNRREVIRLTT